MTVNDLQATATIGGNAMSGYLLQLHRQRSITRIADEFELLLARTMPYTLNPWDTVVLTENGTTVLTGYVDKVVRAREPDHAIRVLGRNTYKRAEDYFISDSNLSTNGERADYWVGYLCDLCGLSYIVSSPNAGVQTTIGYQVGLQTVADALALFAALMQVSVIVNPSGVAVFAPVDVAEPADHNFDPFLDGEYGVGDELARNVAKIWGYNPATGGQLLYQERRDVDGLNNDRIMVVSYPEIQTPTQAQSIAGALLDHFAKLDQESHFSIVGDASVEIGQTGQVEILPGTPDINLITDLAAEVSPAGYTQQLVIGRKNLYLPTYRVLGPGEPVTPPPPPGPVVGGSVFIATSARVARTANFLDASPTWTNITGAITGTIVDMNVKEDDPLNVGLVATDSFIWRCANLQAASPTWSVVATAASFASDYLFSRVLFSKANPNYAYALLYGNTASTVRKVLRSTDAGVTWSLMGSTASFAQLDGRNAFALGASNADLVYLSVGPVNDYNAAIQRSVDGGASWANYAQATPGTPGGVAWDIQTLPGADSTILYWRSTGRFSAKYDGSVETQFPDAESVSADGLGSRQRPYRIVAAPSNPSVIYRGRVVSGFTGSQQFRLDRSVDGGASWTLHLLQTIFSTTNGNICAMDVWRFDPYQIVWGMDGSALAPPSTYLPILCTDALNPTTSNTTNKYGDWTGKVGAQTSQIVRIIRCWEDP